MLSRTTQWLMGRTSYFLACLIAVAYVVAALAPFKPKMPRRNNGASIGEQGILRFAAPGLACTRGPSSWIAQAIDHNHFKINLRIKSSLSGQTGPARIFTVSINPYLRNVTVAQQGDNLVVRLRTIHSDLNGNPSYYVPQLFASPDWNDLELSVDRDELKVICNGKPVLARQLPVKPLANWNRGYRVAMGNEWTGDRPWLGDISRAVVTVSGRQIDCLKPDTLIVPSHFWEGLDVRKVFALSGDPSRGIGTRDALLNFICFVPFGFIFASLDRFRDSFLSAVIFCALASLTIEVAQVFFEGRCPSALDWMLNVTAATFGATIARYLFKSAACHEHARSTIADHQCSA